jgi:hypothetical protein
MHIYIHIYTHIHLCIYTYTYMNIHIYIKGDQATVDKVTSILPKATDLFSSVSTKFININNTKEDHIASFASSMTVEEASKYRKYNPTVDPVIEGIHIYIYIYVYLHIYI